MKAPRIAIHEPTLNDLDYNERSWPQYAEAVEKSGAIAVKIPLSATPATVAQLVSSCDGVLLPGSGADVNPQKYGHERIPECAPADPAREAVDELLIQDAANLNKPIFGICYGTQSWNVWRGGTLIQDLHTGVDHQPGRKVRDAHRISIAEGSRLADIAAAREISVNSSHHQALDQPGDGLKVVARSIEDGVIEAVEGTGEQFILAVQWHPERTFHDNEVSRAMFSAFIDAAIAWRPRKITESVAGGAVIPESE